MPSDGSLMCCNRKPSTLGAHREIFRTALMLHGQGKPTDLTAMVAWLADTGAAGEGGRQQPAQWSWWTGWPQHRLD